MFSEFGRVLSDNELKVMENEANTARTVACCAYNNFIGFVVTVIVFENGFVRLQDVVLVLNLFINVY